MVKYFFRVKILIKNFPFDNFCYYFLGMKVIPIYKMSFYEIFMVFIIFSLIGWFSEVIFTFLFVNHKFVNRGFLHGPLCPIYGVGGLLILLLPPRLYSTWLPLFLFSMVLCTVVEYFSSWILEKLFHTLWWDYSNVPLNINGRVCLMMSVLFGLLGIFVIHFVMPEIMSFINFLGRFWIKRFSLVILVIMILDFAFTVNKLINFHSVLTTIHKIENKFEQHSSIGEIIKKFPSIKSRVYSENMDLLKKHYSLDKVEADKKNNKE